MMIMLMEVVIMTMTMMVVIQYYNNNDNDNYDGGNDGDGGAGGGDATNKILYLNPKAGSSEVDLELSLAAILRACRVAIASNAVGHKHPRVACKFIVVSDNRHVL